MANEKIRQEIEQVGVLYWQVAAALGISESTFSRWLRHPLGPEKESKVRAAIEKARKEG